MGRTKYKKKPQYKKTNKDRIKELERKMAQDEKEEETKFWDEALPAEELFALRDVSGTQNGSWNLTAVGMLQSRTTGTQGSSALIASASRREGRKIYVSGSYLKLQFYWPNIASTVSQRYPPFAHIRWAVVREKVNNAATDMEAVPRMPAANDIYDVTTILGSGGGTAVSEQNAAILSCMPFKSMHNGKNYVVLREGRTLLPGPVANYIGDGQQTTPPTGNGILGNNMASAGSNASPPLNLGHKFSQFANNTVKFVELEMHPKTTTLFRPQLVESDEGYVSLSDLQRRTPVKNGIYLIMWTDVGDYANPGLNQGGSRFGRPTGAFQYVKPLACINYRLRFKDA